MRAGVSQPVVSKHLGVLKQAGLVRDRHEGRNTHYSAQIGALAPLLDWTSQMTGFWEAKFDHLEGRRFRHGTTFLRWRPDRTPESCTYAQIEVVPAFELAKIFGARAE